MTHPEIITMEKTGIPYSADEKIKIGECLYCESNIYESSDTVESTDGMFCDIDCCHEYYEIRKR